MELTKRELANADYNAEQLGITTAQYIRNKKAGLKWCGEHHKWELKKYFLKKNGEYNSHCLIFRKSEDTKDDLLDIIVKLMEIKLVFKELLEATKGKRKEEMTESLNIGNRLILEFEQMEAKKCNQPG
jgi:hypothetical protein